MSAEPALGKVFSNRRDRAVSDSVVGIVKRDYLSVPSLVLIDLAALGLSIFFALLVRSYILMPLFPDALSQKLLGNTFEQVWWFPLLLLFCLAYEHLYVKRLPFWTEVEVIFKAVSLAVIITIFLLYLSKIADEISRTLIVTTWLVLALLLPLFRWYGKLLLVKLKIWSRPVLVAGTENSSKMIIRALSREKTMGYEVKGVLSDDRDHKDHRADQAKTNKNILPAAPVLGGVEDAESILEQTGIKDMIIAMPGLPSRQLVDLANRLQPVVCNLLLVPDLFGLSLSGIEVQYFFEEQTLLLHIKNRLKSAFNRAIKRTFDLALGTLMLLFCLPLLTVLALAVKLDSKGPVFYAGERIGRGGAGFICYKFRTMYSDADSILDQHLAVDEKARSEWQLYKKLITYDPRVTRFGALLRRFSLDELPQLYNVIRGEMSLVGPRPYIPEEKVLMGAWLHDILVAKPGLTGLWQVSGRNRISFEGRLKLDAWYMKNWSPWLDLVLLLKTVRVVLKREGAY